MRTRPLANTPLHASVLALGTVKLGRNHGLKYAEGFPLPTDEEALALLRAASDLGINLIDTAPAYGVSESRLGELLPRVAPRDRWILCTKAGESFENGASTFDFSPAAITASVERSLQRLRTDRLELVLIHSNGDDANAHDAAGPALESLKSRGLIRAWGISTKTPEGALRAANECDAVMLTINAGHPHDLPAASTAGKRGAAVLVKKALASGSASATRSAAALTDALRLALTADGVTSVVVGTINPDHLRANAAAAEETLRDHGN